LALSLEAKRSRLGDPGHMWMLPLDQVGKEMRKEIDREVVSEASHVILSLPAPVI